MTDLSNRPLLGVGEDLERYVPDTVTLSRVSRGIQAGLNVLIIGPGGSGKTTLLHMLERQLLGTGFDKPLIFVTGSLAADAGELLDLVGTELRRVVPEMRIAAGPGPGLHESASSRLLNSVRSLRGEQGALILLDDLPSREAGRTLFGRLRDELWQLPHRWVVAVRSDWSPALTQPPADAFFELKVTVPPLSPDQVRELLWRRGLDELEPELIERVTDLSNGSPLAALMLAREIALGPDDGPKALSKMTDRHRTAAKLGRPASMLLAELESRGPVSASDPDLLNSLGWSRSRATQVLRELEQAGLARSFPAEGSNRRLYGLNQD